MRFPAAILILLLGIPCAGQDAPQLRFSGLRLSRPEGAAAPVPLVTAELSDLTLEEGARVLADALGVPIRVPERPSTAPGASPPVPIPLDYDRRARLTWKDAPTAGVLRDFCRAYRCLLLVDYRGGLSVAPGMLASGPAARLNGHSVEVNRIQFSDWRSVGGTPPEININRALSLQFALRADSGDLSRIFGLQNVRVVDQAGRDVADHPADRGGASPTVMSPFPDERLQTVSFPWPYPNPHRLKTIEGDLVLYRKVTPLQQEIALPGRPGPSEVREVGDVQIQITYVDQPSGGLRATMRVVTPANTGVEISRGLGGATVLLDDGTRVPVGVSAAGWSSSEGWRMLDYSVTARELKSRPVKVQVSLVLQSDPGQRFHFRFDDYPAILGAAPEEPPVGKGAAKAAAKGSAPRAGPTGRKPAVRRPPARPSPPPPLRKKK